MPKGTKFQIMVWNELKKIPEGEVRTYKEIALAIGKPNSASLSALSEMNLKHLKSIFFNLHTFAMA